MTHSKRYYKAMTRAMELTMSCSLEEALQQVKIFINRCETAHDFEALQACKDLYNNLLTELNKKYQF